MNNKFAVGMLVIMLLFTGLSGYLSYSYLKKNQDIKAAIVEIVNIVSLKFSQYLFL